MTLRDKELEDRIEELGNKLTSPPSDVQQLLQLLDKAENFLSRVEQCPPQSMHTALSPSMNALVTKDLLRHSDLDVKIAVASCLSEITRITAPDAPYDDDLMKEIFGLIVGAFKNLDEFSSRSFSKRVSILETVAKVRSCVLMLDLECDDLILDMFHHFLKTIRLKHSDTVFSSMETVMSLVIEESENISAKLLSCLLDNLKTDEKNILSSAKKLAEKVLSNCASKLKPYLVEEFKGTSALSDYSKIVTVVCQGNLDTLTQNDISTFGETQADDSKLSEGTLCAELPQGSAKQEHELAVGKAVTDTDGSSKLVTSNGTLQMGNGDSMASEQKAEVSQPDVQLRDTDGFRLADSDNLGSGAAKLDSGLSLSSRKGRRKGTLVKLSVNSEHKQIDDEKETPTITGRRKGRSKEADSTQVDGLPFKEVETASNSKSRKKNKLEPTPGLADVSSSISLHIPNEHDRIQSRKSRSSRSKKKSGKRNVPDKAAADGSFSASGHRDLLESSRTTSGDIPTRGLSSKKSEGISDSEKKLSKFSASKSHAHVEDGKTTPTTTHDSEKKHRRHRVRSGSKREGKEEDSSGQKQSAGKQEMGGSVDVGEEDKEVKLKELVSLRKSAAKESIKDQSLLKDISEPKSRRKRARVTEETFETPKRRKSNEKLIGAKIKVWWPDDECFYEGIVDSFDRSTKKHKVLYNDGDVEVLLLKNEKWEFIEAETKADGENNTPDIIASDSRKKKSKGRRGGSAADKMKTDLPANSPDPIIKTESNDKSSKRKGRTPSVNVPDDETPKKATKGRRRSANRHPDNTQKDNNELTETTDKSVSEKLPQSTAKADPSKSADKVDNDKSKSGDKVRSTLKIRRKSDGDSSISNTKSKGVGPKSPKKSKDEDSLKTKSSTEGRQKSGGRSAKGSSKKVRGGSTPRINRNLNAEDAPKSDQAKVEEVEHRGTTGKKRKRGRLGR
ncbi:uncharacterized protein LOC110021984 [Phalaenopsis equestris]|uniref:uncharacterized protein LOC110021984 n=1 Tax=Phalaenopsis equestris TaxID=78828 RepID=UPI0009E34DEB|nr:uncharacterized protein LOC110021984 [Phalaenopsis equestris]